MSGSLRWRLPRKQTLDVLSIPTCEIRCAAAVASVASICVPAARAEQVKNLKPQGYVNDFAGVLSAQAKDKLTALCAEVQEKTKAQIAIVTISSLEGQPLEQFSIDLATAWGIGPKQLARGILILFSPNDRRDRVEVGYGLEPILPDGKVGGFEREIVPLLRQNDYSGAVLLITQRVAAVIAEDQKVTLDNLSGVSTPPGPESDNSPAPLGNLVEASDFCDFHIFPVDRFSPASPFRFRRIGAFTARRRNVDGRPLVRRRFDGVAAAPGEAGVAADLADSAEDRLAAAARAGAGEIRDRRSRRGARLIDH